MPKQIGQHRTPPPSPEDRQSELDRARELAAQVPDAKELEARRIADPILASIAQGSTLKAAIANYNQRFISDYSNLKQISANPKAVSVGNWYQILDKYPAISRMYLLAQRARAGVLIDQACELVDSVDADNVRVVDCKLRGLRWITQSLASMAAKADDRHERVVRGAATVNIQLLDPASQPGQAIDITPDNQQNDR